MVRRGGEESPAAGFFHQSRVIDVRLEAQERKLEAVLTAALAMTPAAIAASFVNTGTI